jgi:hypothetical protein
LVIIVQVLLPVLQHKRKLKDTGKQRIAFRGAIQGQYRNDGRSELTIRNRSSNKSGRHAAEFPTDFVKSRSIVTVLWPEGNQGNVPRFGFACDKATEE